MTTTNEIFFTGSIYKSTTTTTTSLVVDKTGNWTKLATQIFYTHLSGNFTKSIDNENHSYLEKDNESDNILSCKCV